ncbi:DoxX family protein [Marnyiella aurantia]|uniref:DoxX family protein n=1 Tax=Marnyiella aurantia TaxID=2758037 RepID=A0A7D7LTA5_9FLAO|nr:DoxX family protein [Marnyiella aurantia]MBA5246420.1 DoxX family protein [Marnyiella aurantia]MBP0612768.1 DoxX family protein [Marnyiella aurantia]QMS98213.1 DoxX family protein [Marnyiella aurantia]
MNYFSSVKVNPLIADIVLLVVRIFIGFAMISHGFPKLMQLTSGEEIQFFNFLGLGERFSLILAVIAEFVGSIFIILGLFSRPAVFLLIITMAIAGLIVHSADPFPKREASLIYLSVYLMLFAFGPGRYSIDSMLERRRETAW